MVNRHLVIFSVPQWGEPEPAALSWCQSTHCWPGTSFFNSMKVSPSNRVFSQNAPSPRTRRWITLWSRSP